MNKEDMKRWLNAVNFATEKHKGQERRGSGLPYIIHPYIVAKFVEAYSDRNTIDIQIAALLHDTVEDTDATIEEIIEMFGTKISNLVIEMTDDKEAIKKTTKVEYHKNKLLHMTDDALYLKLCDRLSNVGDLPRKQYVKGTMEVLDYLFENRNLDFDQTAVASDIYEECQNFQVKNQ